MRTPTIVHIDNEIDVLVLTRYFLEKEGFKVYSYEEIDLLIAELDEVKPDIILVDLAMRFDGVSVIKRFQEAQINCRMAFFTGYDPDSQLVKDVAQYFRMEKVFFKPNNNNYKELAKSLKEWIGE